MPERTPDSSKGVPSLEIDHSALKPRTHPRDRRAAVLGAGAMAGIFVLLPAEIRGRLIDALGDAVTLSEDHFFIQRISDGLFRPYLEDHSPSRAERRTTQVLCEDGVPFAIVAGNEPIPPSTLSGSITTIGHSIPEQRVRGAFLRFYSADCHLDSQRMPYAFSSWVRPDTGSYVDVEPVYDTTDKPSTPEVHSVLVVPPNAEGDPPSFPMLYTLPEFLQDRASGGIGFYVERGNPAFPILVATRVFDGSPHVIDQGFKRDLSHLIKEYGALRVRVIGGDDVRLFLREERPLSQVNSVSMSVDDFLDGLREFEPPKVGKKTRPRTTAPTKPPQQSRQSRLPF